VSVAFASYVGFRRDEQYELEATTPIHSRPLQRPRSLGPVGDEGQGRRGPIRSQGRPRQGRAERGTLTRRSRLELTSATPLRPVLVVLIPVTAPGRLPTWGLLERAVGGVERSCDKRLQAICGRTRRTTWWPHGEQGDAVWLALE
jgi:hypothetical protein